MRQKYETPIDLQGMKYRYFPAGIGIKCHGVAAQAAGQLDARWDRLIGPGVRSPDSRRGNWSMSLTSSGRDCSEPEAVSPVRLAVETEPVRSGELSDLAGVAGPARDIGSKSLKNFSIHRVVGLYQCVWSEFIGFWLILEILGTSQKLSRVMRPAGISLGHVKVE